MCLWAYSSLHEFQLWPQVTILQGSAPDLSTLLTQAHLLRYILVYPIFLGAEFVGVDPNFIFNTLCFFMLFFVSVNCVRTTRFYISGNFIILVGFFASLFALMSIFMNGRIIFAFFGFSYLVACIHQWESYQFSNFELFLRILISIFLCSVSTGTFLLCVICLLLWLPIFIRRPKGSFLYYVLIFLCVLSPLISFYIMKNVIFYGGGMKGFINMLNHGVGVIFYTLELDLIVLIGLILIVFSIFALIFFRYTKLYSLLFIFLSASAFGGLFGFSTLSLGIIPLSIILIIMVTKLLKGVVNQR